MLIAVMRVLSDSRVIAASVFLSIFCFAPSSARAIQLQLEGTYGGSINGIPVNAQVVGQIDTDGGLLNHYELHFSAPLPFDPIVAGLSWKSSYHGMALARDSTNPANLWDLSSGNYIASRSVRYPTLASSNFFDFYSQVNTVNGVAYSNGSSVLGIYAGPTDIQGIIDYSMVWNQVDATTIRVDTTAKLLRANGDFIPMEITQVYSQLSSQMPVPRQYASETISATWDGTNSRIKWTGQISREVPGPVPFLGVIAAFKFSRKLRQRLKTNHLDLVAKPIA